MIDDFDRDSIAIQDDVPRPGIARERFPFHRMEIGQSFFVALEDVDFVALNSARQHYELRNQPAKFITRKAEREIHEEGKTRVQIGRRVWRVQ